jgi:biotin-independent malonate decarboxylase beta subunit/biotin-independent malonate decarboxylase gamma subunit
VTDWTEVLRRRSFLELDATGRAGALLDPGTLTVLCGPFDRVESPWLVPQALVPQADDGVTTARGLLDGAPVAVASIEQGFLGGGIGEVSGAKIAQLLRLAAAAEPPLPAVLLLETGGVRLQEAHLGLNAVAEICSALLELRPLAPVVGVVTGPLGSFGGVSIAAGLCTRLIVTRESRLGLNGPAVVEQEAGVEEFDSSDRALIWSVHGGEQRHAVGLADTLVPDDVDALRAAVRAALAAGVTTDQHRSERVDVLRTRLSTLDPADPLAPAALRELWGPSYEPPPPPGSAPATPAPDQPPAAGAPDGRATAGPDEAAGSGRGRAWLGVLAGVDPVPVIPSVLRADTGDAVYLAVVPDPDSRYPQARAGEVGLAECLALAETIRAVQREDADRPGRRAIVAVVDLPSQAYGRLEELAGLHQAIATTVDAYAAARVAGHPVVALVVGSAISGGFLAHGLQAAQILALDDPGVEIHAMHKEAAARITRRTVAELDELARTVVPLSFDVRDWARLGFCDGLLPVEEAGAPTEADTASVRRAVAEAIDRARTGPRDLSNRLDSPGARELRAASRRVREVLAEQWAGE